MSTTPTTKSSTKAKRSNADVVDRETQLLRLLRRPYRPDRDLPVGAFLFGAISFSPRLPDVISYQDSDLESTVKLRPLDSEVCLQCEDGKAPEPSRSRAPIQPEELSRPRRRAQTPRMRTLPCSTESSLNDRPQCCTEQQNPAYETPVLHAAAKRQYCDCANPIPEESLGSEASEKGHLKSLTRMNSVA